MGSIEEKGCDLFIRVNLQPRASKNEISGEHDGFLKVRLTSPPVDGAANALLIEFMSKRLGIAKSSAEILQGHRSRRKILKVGGITEAAARKLLVE